MEKRHVSETTRRRLLSLVVVVVGFLDTVQQVCSDLCICLAYSVYTSGCKGFTFSSSRLLVSLSAVHLVEGDQHNVIIPLMEE